MTRASLIQVYSPSTSRLALNRIQRTPQLMPDLNSAVSSEFIFAGADKRKMAFNNKKRKLNAY